jgi:hypothetical protein
MTAAAQPRTRRSPDQGFASVGAVRQNAGGLPVYICNACESEVVWATSKRTGRKYMAKVSRGHMQQRYYIGARVHTEEQCQAIQAEHQRGVAAILREIRAREGQCVDCGDEPVWDNRLDEPYHRCMDCIMALRAEAEALLAEAQAEAAR